MLFEKGVGEGMGMTRAIFLMVCRDNVKIHETKLGNLQISIKNHIPSIHWICNFRMKFVI